MVNKLKDLKAKSKLTSQQISDISGVPYSTVCRFLAGEQTFQQAQNLADIVHALGGSLDEFFGIDKEAAPSELVSLYQSVIAAKDKEIESKDKELEAVKRACKRLIVTVGIVTAVLITVLLIDLFNGGFGYIRY